ncbi:MAG: TrkH family potassium uptake protein, partial [Allobaculum sp.]|nr:TrkH family potassium uptake protein [Allobaculum sp.]
MNRRAILYILGVICQAEGFFMFLPGFCGYIFGEFDVGTIYLLWGLVCIVVGFLICQVKAKATNFRYTPQEAMLITALAWILLSVLGCVPFLLAGEIANPIDAFFETVSGFTTTGSTIIPNLDVISKASLFWRSFTHWIGGMGVLVFLLALLPIPSATFMNLMAAESPGPEVSKLVPRVQVTAKYLYLMYIVLTILELILLLVWGMDLFDAITLTMGTAGTGGFAVRASGFDDYTQAQQFIIAIFMLLFGINFTWYFFLVNKKWREAIKMQEVWAYLGIIVFVTIAIVVSLMWVGGYDFTLGQAFHHVFFTVVSLITTTGYATVDFNFWPTVALVLLVMIMFIGACAGSTGGGIKVSRFLVSFKGIRKQFGLIAHPKRIATVRLDG